jgi:hypothetical protein
MCWICDATAPPCAWARADDIEEVLGVSAPPPTLPEGFEVPDLADFLLELALELKKTPAIKAALGREERARRRATPAESAPDTGTTEPPAFYRVPFVLCLALLSF